MQFGIFSIGDVTPDPTTGRVPTEHERIKATVAIAKKAEEVGLDVFAIGQHHNPPFVAPANPPILMAHVAAQTERILLSTATTLITTTDPVRIAEDYAYVQHLADGRVDLTLGRGNTGPVYPWFGKDIRAGVPLAVENYALLHRLWREAVQRSRDLVTELMADDGDLAQVAKRPFADGGAVSLRWVLVHMVEEYARHNGHADLLREAVDGLTGE